jgi:hypothetical protein
MYIAGAMGKPCRFISIAATGVWRSWLARRVWDAEAGGSSPLTPTKVKGVAEKVTPFTLV